MVAPANHCQALPVIKKRTSQVSEIAPNPLFPKNLKRYLWLICTDLATPIGHQDTPIDTVYIVIVVVAEYIAPHIAYSRATFYLVP